eukprot:1012150-Pelagomonas_calceolata.AAC.9
MRGVVAYGLREGGEMHNPGLLEDKGCHPCIVHSQRFEGRASPIPVDATFLQSMALTSNACAVCAGEPGAEQELEPDSRGVCARPHCLR